MTTAEKVPVWTGFCNVGRHQTCRGGVNGHPCPCPCHQEPEPEPPAPRLLTVGQRVICGPGARWANEDLTGQELEVIEVHEYPADVGGPVFICRWPGTTTRAAYAPHLQNDQIGGAA